MISKGDKVLCQDGEQFFLGNAGDLLQTGFGSLDLRKAIGKNWGDKIESSSGRAFTLLKPNFADEFSRLRRGPQIITQKDASLMVALAGVSKSSVVAEGGSGSGALTAFLANAACTVHSYEKREDFLELAKKNCESFSNVVFHHADLADGIEPCEAIFLDVPEPVPVLPAISTALVPGGTLAVYLPTLNQVDELATALRGLNEFSQLECLESIVRHYQLKPRAVRPKNTGLMHTGFICWCRKVS